MTFKVCVAVLGPGENASPDAISDALSVGRAIANRGWITLTGGRDAGVMDAAARGASEMRGITVGILPGTDTRGASTYLTIALPTGLGEARNAVLVTAADAVIVCGMNPGTASEVALALRAGKPSVLVRPGPHTASFFASLGGDVVPYVTADPEDAVAHFASFL